MLGLVARMESIIVATNMRETAEVPYTSRYI